MTETTPPASGPPGSGAPASDEQAREYLQQLRSAPAEQLVTEVLSGLLNTAQVKLGRRDARLLIDLSAVVLEHSRRYLPDELGQQVDQILGQLRLGQVRAENAAAKQPTPEPNDLAETPAPPPGPAGAQSAEPASPSAAAPQPPDQPSSAVPPPVSRLWIPGRDF